MTNALSRCKEKLNETALAAIRGKYDEGLGLEALAAKLKRSVAATKQLIYRTRLTLRDCIENQLAAEGGDA